MCKKYKSNTTSQSINMGPISRSRAKCLNSASKMTHISTSENNHQSIRPYTSLIKVAAFSELEVAAKRSSMIKWSILRSWSIVHRSSNWLRSKRRREMPVGRNVVGEILAKRSVLCSLLSIMLNKKVKNLICSPRSFTSTSKILIEEP